MPNTIVSAHTLTLQLCTQRARKAEPTLLPIEFRCTDFWAWTEELPSPFRVTAVLDRETSSDSDVAPLTQNVTSFLFLDGFKRLQACCNGPDGSFQRSIG